MSSNINITGLYDNYRDTLEVQTQLTSDTSTILNGSTAISGTCTINGVSVMDSISSIQSIASSIQSDVADNTTNIITLFSDVSNNTADISTLYEDLSANFHELKGYTDDEVEALRNEGYIQEAAMFFLEMITSSKAF